VNGELNKVPRIKVFDVVAPRMFKKFLSDSRSDLGADIELHHDGIWITETPTPLHEALTKGFTAARTAANTKLSGGPNRPFLSCGSDYLVSNTISMQPDASFVHEHPDKVMPPSVIVEIADTLELKELDIKVQNYFKYYKDIRMVLAVYASMYSTTTSLVFLVYHRGESIERGEFGIGVPPSIAISFGNQLHPQTEANILLCGITETSFTGVGRGDPLCNMPGMPAYIYNIPSDVWNAITYTPIFNIDLFQIKGY
jgi:Putative restriction endonuclease